MPPKRGAFVAVVTLLGTIALFGSACIATKNSGADGSRCSDSDDCKSKSCSEGQCAGSTCSTPGSSGGCSEGWICKHYEPSSISSFFGANGSNSCAPTCGYCPEHWSCAGGATTGTGDAGTKGALCVYDHAWQNPKVVIDQPDHPDGGNAIVTPNQEVTFHAAISTPSGANLKTVNWTFGSEPPVSGITVKHTFPSTGAIQVTSVNVAVTDEANRYATETLSITVCGLANDQCRAGDTRDSNACCGGLSCVQDQGTGTARCK